MHCTQTIKQASRTSLVDVITERSVYREALDKAKSSVTSHFTRDSIFSPPPAGTVAPNSTPVIAHYSFDMAQQVFYPNDPLQPALCTFEFLRSVQYLECAVSPLKLMKLLTWGRAPMPSSACSTTSLYTMG